MKLASGATHKATRAERDGSDDGSHGEPRSPAEGPQTGPFTWQSEVSRFKVCSTRFDIFRHVGLATGAGRCG